MTNEEVRDQFEVIWNGGPLLGDYDSNVSLTVAARAKPTSQQVHHVQSKPKGPKPSGRPRLDPARESLRLHIQHLAGWVTQAEIARRLHVSHDFVYRTLGKRCQVAQWESRRAHLVHTSGDPRPPRPRAAPLDLIPLRTVRVRILEDHP